MTNDVGLNAESDLHPNQDEKILWFMYKRYYWRLHYNSDIHAKRRGQLKSNQYEAQLLYNRTKVDNHCTLLLNIYF